MASNQTIAQIPSDLSDPNSMRRFLSTLVQNLDKVLGYSGDSKYTTDKQLDSTNTTVSELDQTTATLTDTTETISTSLADTQSDVIELQDAVDAIYVAATLDEDFKDFNATVWADLKGPGEMTGLGSDFTNPPATLTPGDTYSFYASSISVTNSVVVLLWQYSAGNPVIVYSRRGVSSTWTVLG